VAEILLGLRDIVVRYDGRAALDVPRLEVIAHQTLAIIGPNGAGKSTLLRVMGLLQRPSAGTLWYRGENVYAADPLSIRRRMAAVFQEPLLLNASVYENAALGLKLRRLSQGEIQRRLTPWLERLGIAHLSARPARTLSGGEAQRTSLARALALEPELLLLDEPFAGVDPASRESLQRDFRRIAEQTHMTTALVTHDRDEAFSLGKTIGVLKEGRLLQLGSREEVFLYPKTEAVAEIVGIDNRLPGVVETQDGGCSVIAVAGRRLRVRVACKPRSRVTVCLRAEDIALDPSDGPSGPLHRWEGRIIEMHRGRTHDQVVLDCGRLRLVALRARKAGAALPLREGDCAAAVFSAEAVHVIEAEKEG